MYMSGKCEIEDVQRDVQEKGFGFIRKPFALNTLTHTIAQFLRTEPHKTRKKGPAHEDLPPAASCFGGGSE
jgi:DNA-binding NtrC family response regulator